jgi:RNA polymerase sigma factor (sigma-70 family)
VDTSSAGTTLTPYLSRVGAVALLTAEQEVDLAKRVAAGVALTDIEVAATPDGLPYPSPSPRTLSPDDAAIVAGEAVRAADVLVRSNLRLVISLARRHQGRGLDLADIVQEGNLGLMKAVERFDHTRGFRFSTYAAWWIRQAITRGIADRSRTVRLPVHAHELVSKLRWVELDLWQRTGREPSDAELATALGTSVQRLRLLREANAHPTSLDASSGDDRPSVGERLADPAAVDPIGRIAAEEVKRDVTAALERLDPRERTVVELRYGLTDGLPCTLEEIGQHLGVTRERVRQIEIRALRKLQAGGLDDLREGLSA